MQSYLNYYFPSGEIPQSYYQTARLPVARPAVPVGSKLRVPVDGDRRGWGAVRGHQTL